MERHQSLTQSTSKILEKRNFTSFNSDTHLKHFCPDQKAENSIIASPRAKRYHPLEPMALTAPAIVALLAVLGERPDCRWRESDIERMRFDLSNVRRSFKRQFGMTLLEMVGQRRLRDGFEKLGDSGAVIEGQLETNFDSASAFRAAFLNYSDKCPTHCRQSHYSLLIGFQRRSATWFLPPASPNFTSLNSSTASCH